MLRETFDLSGFSGAYEEQCQRMLWRGVKHLEAVNPPPEMWRQAKSIEGVYGVVMTEGKDLKALEKAIMRPGDDATGPMHHCVLAQLAFIHRKGLTAWADHLRLHRVRSYLWNDEKMEWAGDFPAGNISKDTGAPDHNRVDQEEP